MATRPKSSDLFRGIRTLEIVMDKEGKPHKLCIQEKYLLYTLATFADPDGTNIYPGMKVLIRATGWKESAVFKWMKKIEECQLLIPDGRHGYTRKFRLNIPGITPIVVDQDQTNISSKEWESQFLTDEELQEQGLDQAQPPFQEPDELEENQGLQLPPPPDELEGDDEPTQPMPVVMMSPETPPPIVGRLPAVVDSRPPMTAERLERDIGVLRESANLVLRGILKKDIYIRGGRRKGFSDDFLEMMLGREGVNGSFIGSQPGEPSITTIPLENSTYQP